MGTTSQKRLVRRLDLERALQSVGIHPSPKASLEQYTIPVDVASEMLFLSAYVHDDIVGKIVADLGCGTGRLAIGAASLGARQSVGVDIDKPSVKLAKDSSMRLNLQGRTDWIVGDISVLHARFDTILQNPPFGVQKKRADRKFLVTAIELGSRVYSLHKGGDSNRAFIKSLIEKHGARVTGIYSMKLNIPRLFKFHTKPKHEVNVDLYRIETEGN